MDAAFIVITVIVINSFVLIRASIPKGYILDIKPQCGSDGVTDAIISVVSDYPVHAHGICAGGKSVAFGHFNSATYQLFISYPVDGGGNSSCVFKSGPGTQSYSVQVQVWYGESEFVSMVHQKEEEYALTCTYSPHGSNESSEKSIIPGFTRLRQIQSHRGPPSGSHIDLTLSDVLNHEIPLGEIHLGRTVILAASSNNTADVGIRTLFCDAINSRGDKYAVLRFGCGDGLVFDKYAGFTTTGRHVESPYFKMFSINADQSLTFECNFTICSTNCDGSSCISPFPKWRRQAIKVTTKAPEINLPSRLARSPRYHLIKSGFTAVSPSEEATPLLRTTR